MGAYILKRLFMLIPVLFGISIIVFFIISLIPGDPAQAILGSYATAENLAKLRSEMGLDKSLIHRYFIWLGNLLQGDFGQSYTLNRPVIQEVMDRLGPTLLLAGTSLFLCTVFGLIIGVVTAIRQYGWQDKLFTLLALLGISTPSFWLGLMVILLFSVKFAWFPVSGMYTAYGGGGVWDVLHHLALPAVTLAAVATGVIARLTRSGMLESLRQDFVLTARAKGLSEWIVIWRHAFKNAFVTIVPVIGIQAGFVIGGAVYIETVFQWPGIGRMLVTAITTRDILLVQGGVLVVAACYVLFNLFADIVQHLLDPRISI
jgi:peptide/nickel transport system permease protein